ncbi:TIGR04076 family protein [Sciscionella marina]|uniref:TIGR04076 family protein n=1 Tax=Sciscionella marina TaxID=508770 RepID=UPI00058E6381|nr:TIGR04076 family protein [Sciscionella marina]
MTGRIRCTVEAMNYSACGMSVGDRFDIHGGELSLPQGRGFCFYAIAAVANAMAGRENDMTLQDWASEQPLIACPDPPENLVMRMRHLPEGVDEHGR